MAKSKKTPPQGAAKQAVTHPETGAQANEGGFVAHGTMPLEALLCGALARRKSWANGITLFVGTVGGRGGGKSALLINGSRGGNRPYLETLKDSDDLLAEDWQVAEVVSEEAADS